MKYFIPALLLICSMSCERETYIVDIVNPGAFEDTVIDVDPAHFLSASLAEPVITVPCTLSDGSTTNCFRIVATGNPSDHPVGPWCPREITDGKEAGGIYLDGTRSFEIDGAFIERLGFFYGDANWRMFDGAGRVLVTETAEDYANAISPATQDAYQNYCVELRPDQVPETTRTYLIPVTPARSTGSPTAGFASPTQTRGIAFNGITFKEPLAIDEIRKAYTLLPLDDAGGHISPEEGYHYHAATGVSTSIPQEDGHAAMIGYAMDGHGIYAYRDAAGVAINDNFLDACRGHYDHTRGYHYHVDEAGANTLLNCLHGPFAD
ncbi:MAG: YHYH protein [Bacteroidota bacterium]